MNVLHFLYKQEMSDFDVFMGKKQAVKKNL